jgi:hypothetical protein
MEERRSRKSITAFGNGHIALLTGPGINILEKVVMEGLEVGVVEITRRWIFQESLGYLDALKGFKLRSIANSGDISENG